MGGNRLIGRSLLFLVATLLVTGLMPIVSGCSSGSFSTSGTYTESARSGKSLWVDMGTPTFKVPKYAHVGGPIVLNGNSIFMACQNGHVYRHEAGKTWKDIGSVGDPPATDLCSDGTTVYAGNNTGHVSSFNGTGWTDRGIVDGSNVLRIVSAGPTLFVAGAGTHVYRNDGGTTWTDLGTFAYSDIEAFVWNGTNLFAGCVNGHVYRYDGGVKWTDIGGDRGGSIDSLAWNGKNLFEISMNGHVYIYEGGTTWADTGRAGGGYETNFGGSGIPSLSWNGRNLYGGFLKYRVYRYDGGTTWTDIGSSPVSEAGSLVSDGANLYADCGDGGHVYSLKLSQ